jgi:hypothetical protein
MPPTSGQTRCGDLRAGAREHEGGRALQTTWVLGLCPRGGRGRRPLCRAATVRPVVAAKPQGRDAEREVEALTLTVNARGLLAQSTE